MFLNLFPYYFTYLYNYRIVEKLAELLLPKKGQIINKQRFYDEFGEGKDEEAKQEEKKHILVAFFVHPAPLVFENLRQLTFCFTVSDYLLIV